MSLRVTRYSIHRYAIQSNCERGSSFSRKLIFSITIVYGVKFIFLVLVFFLHNIVLSFKYGVSYCATKLCKFRFKPRIETSKEFRFFIVTITISFFPQPLSFSNGSTWFVEYSPFKASKRIQHFNSTMFNIVQRCWIRCPEAKTRMLFLIYLLTLRHPRRPRGRLPDFSSPRPPTLFAPRSAPGSPRMTSTSSPEDVTQFVALQIKAMIRTKG